jgi:hypothetical protein
MDKVFCLVHGEDPTQNVFPVEVIKNATISELKKLIRAEKSPEFDDIAADKLTLWKVNISEDQLCDLDDADPETLGKKLSPLSKIAKVFPDGVEGGHIHIIVVRPAVAKEDLVLTGWFFFTQVFIVSVVFVHMTNKACLLPLCRVVAGQKAQGRLHAAPERILQATKRQATASAIVDGKAEGVQG